MAPDAARRDAGPPCSQESLPYSRAFVVRLGTTAGVRPETVTGRIEHLKTGRRVRFGSADEMVTGLLALLADAEASREERPDGPSGP